MTGDPTQPRWSNVAVLIGRLIFVAVFAMAVSFKLYDTGETATSFGTSSFRSIDVNELAPPIHPKLDVQCARRDIEKIVALEHFTPCHLVNDRAKTRL